MKACPVCALEVEDSYLFCPEDGASLTDATGATAAQAVTAKLRTIPKPRLTRLNLSRPDIDSPRRARLNEESKAYSVNGSNETDGTVADIEPTSDETESHEPEQKRFRLAAIATIVALGVFVLLGTYTLLSGLSRRPSRVTQSANQPANQPEVAQPFVVTPQEAQDYKEEQPTPPPEEGQPEPPAVAKVINPVRSDSAPKPSNKDPKPDVIQPAAPVRRPAMNPVSVSTAPAPAAPPQELPRANSGDFDSRLVRARASKTAAGYRYDLTFNLKEQRGRAAQWQRVLVTTRSASGTNHTQALPFFHRLGGTGALTFTISVELTGRSEADWRGRVNCTALGWDNSGAPLQTSFVATVTP